MILVEQTTLPAAVLPIVQFREYLRLGTGFADDNLQDGVLETCLRASLAAIEARTGKAILERDFRWSLTGWRDRDRQVFPIAPVKSITEVTLEDRAGQETVIPSSAYVLERDDHRPAIAAMGCSLPSIPRGGSAEILFVAGYAAAWEGVPATLRNACLMLATHFYENRHAMAFEADGIPSAIGEMVHPFLNLRLFGGR